MPTVSIIMGVYNCKRADLLDNSIHSIINQTYTDWEFLICNDGSTDGTEDLLKRYETQDSRIRVLAYDKNQGLCHALNICIKEARGTYIARQDDDDVSYPERLQKLINFAEEHLEYAVVGSIADVFDDNGIWGEYLLEERPTKKSFYWNSPFAHPTVLIRKKALDSIGGYRVAKETQRCEDYDLFMRMYAAGYKGYNIQEKLYQYRIVNGNKKYRSMKDRMDEAVVRFKGFKQMGIVGGGDSLCIEANICWNDSTKFVQENQKETVYGLISIIMPVYNTLTDLLNKAVASVIAQTYKNFELLIIDDGSKESCAKACDRLMEIDERIRVIHINNAGVSAARNRGIEESRGEFIAFIDSDDTMPDNSLQVMIDEINGVDFVVCGCRHVQLGNKEKERIEGPRGLVIKKRESCIEYLCYMNSPFSNIETNAIWGKLYRRKQINSIRFNENMVMAEDFRFNFDYIMSCSMGKYLDFIGYKYLERGGSLSRKYNPKMVITIDILEKMVNEYMETSVYKALLSRSINIAFTILMMIPKDKQDDTLRIENFISKYRNQVLRNPQTKKKVKAGVLSSYISYKLTKLLNSCYSLKK